MSAIRDWQLVQRQDQAECLLDPVRQKILELLREPGSASSIGQDVGLPRQQVNYHLKRLEAVGLVHHTGQSKKRNCFEQYYQSSARSYSIGAQCLGELCLSRTAPGANPLIRAAGMGERLTAEAANMAQTQSAESAPPVLTLDTSITFAKAEDRAAFGKEFREALNGLLAKYGADSGPSEETFRVLLAIHPKP